MKKFFVFCVLVFILIVSSAKANISDEIRDFFHSAQAEPEKVLDAFLHQKNNDALTNELSLFLHELKERKKAGKCVPLADMYLCEDGNEIPNCGLSTRHGDFAYRTLATSAHQVKIEAQESYWLKQKDVPLRQKIFHLVQKDKGWYVNAVDCEGLGKYNLSTKEILERYHLPSTEPEKVLATIISRENDDKNWNVYGFIANHPRAREKQKKLVPLFTKSFLDRFEAEEKKLITESCGGVYPKDGLPCDMIREINPVVCAQDSPDIYLYRTISSDKNKAFVTYTWAPLDMEDGPVYRLVKEGSQWKLDATSCGEEKLNL